MNHKGQSLIEVIVAAAVGILVVTALTFATIFSLRNANFAKNSSQATKLAQEGIEKVKSMRDRNTPIRGNFYIVSGTLVDSWQDADLWSNRINGNCGNTTSATPTYCYFKINTSNELQYLTVDSTIPSSAEDIPPTNPIFRRVVILSDDANYTIQKQVTVIVQWTDFAGPHESKLTTILRRL